MTLLNLHRPGNARPGPLHINDRNPPRIPLHTSVVQMKIDSNILRTIKFDPEGNLRSRGGGARRAVPIGDVIIARQNCSNDCIAQVTPPQIVPRNIGSPVGMIAAAAVYPSLRFSRCKSDVSLGSNQSRIGIGFSWARQRKVRFFESIVLRLLFPLVRLAFHDRIMN